MTVLLPERPLLAELGHRKPAPERTLDVGRQVLLLQQEADELPGPRLVPRLAEDDADLDRRAIAHGRSVGLARKAGGGDQLVVVLPRLRALLGGVLLVVGVVEPLRCD